MPGELARRYGFGDRRDEVLRFPAVPVPMVSPSEVS
jgi:hypothetical protein